MQAKIVSSLEKCFLDETVEQKPQLGSISMLKNERYSFQICYQEQERDPNVRWRNRYFRVESPLADFIHVSRVEYIPSAMPAFRDIKDNNYLRTEPGLYPDLLRPLEKNERLPLTHTLHALWLEVAPEGQVAPGSYPVKCVFTKPDGTVQCELTTQIEIIDALLPDQQMLFTQWFYTDCLMQYYGTKAFSEKHWRIIEAFMRNAKKYGMNMILTPVLTPALDTYVGGERPTTQLVDITVENGEYRFDFSRLGRWVDLCDKVGIQHFEISHFFTQWGAAACPKVVAVVNGKRMRIFGWNTSSESKEYERFLQALIPQMLAFLKTKNGADRRCYFHLSDEPKQDALERYHKLSAMLKPLLAGYPLMDALSDYAFYETGATDCPVVSTNHTEAFLEHNVPNLWVYYCLGQAQEVSNRFFAMPSARTRIIGTQFYKFNIAGFLHWGYNFYNDQYSYRTINPFLCSDGDRFAPSGDTYSVYPGTNGQPWPSLRQVVFHDALQDLRALRLCEKLCGREETMRILEDGINPITFKQYPHDADYILNLRRRINKAIADRINKT